MTPARQRIKKRRSVRRSASVSSSRSVTLRFEPLEQRHLLSASGGQLPDEMIGDAVGTSPDGSFLQSEMPVRLDPPFSLLEFSGLEASWKNPGVLWTHNDSGGQDAIFGFNAQGGYLGAMAAGNNEDWEDITVGPGPVPGETYIFLSDTGDNVQNDPDDKIYRVLEPMIDPEGGIQSMNLSNVDVININYPGGNAYDVESLAVDPWTGDLFLLTKRGEFSQVFRVKAPQAGNSTVNAELMGQMDWGDDQGGGARGPVALDISRSGQEIIVKGYQSISYYQRPLGTTVDEVLTTPGRQYVPYTVLQKGEGLTFDASDSGYFTTGESMGEQGPSTPVYLQYNPRDADAIVPDVTQFQDGVYPSPMYGGTRDVYLENATNVGSAATIIVSDDTTALLHWDLSGMGADITVEDVALLINVLDPTAAGGFQLFETLRPWQEDEATQNDATASDTWEAAGASGATDRDLTLLGTLVPTATGSYMAALNPDGVAVVQSWIDNPAENNGFVLANLANTNTLEFHSREAVTAQLRPQLLISTTPNDLVSPTAEVVYPGSDHDLSTPEFDTNPPTKFEILLDDQQIDDATVDSAAVMLSGPGGALVDGVDYAFSYDAASDRITFTPANLRFGVGDYQVTLSLGGGDTISDAAGNDMPLTVIDILVSQQYPLPLAAKLPAGGLIYDPTVAGEILTASDSQTYTIEVDSHQGISFQVTPDGSLQPHIQLLGPGGMIDEVTASAAGETVVYQTHDVGVLLGMYQFVVTGAGGTTGAYEARLVLGADIETEPVEGGTNDTAATAQDITGSLVTNIGGGSKRGAVLGRLDLGYAQVVLADSPVAYWRFDEPSGASVANRSALGSSIDAQYAGGRAQGVPGLLPNGNGRAVSLDGASGRIDVNENMRLLTDSHDVQRTIELWFRADSIGGRRVIFEEGAGRRGTSIYLDGSQLMAGSRNTVIDDGGQTDQTFRTTYLSTPIDVGTTYHVVLVLDTLANTLTGYLNGDEFDSDSVLGEQYIFPHDNDVAFGRRRNGTAFPTSTSYSGNGNYFDGVIDEAAIYDTALSAAQVLAHYDAAAVPSTDDYYRVNLAADEAISLVLTTQDGAAASMQLLDLSENLVALSIAGGTNVTHRIDDFRSITADNYLIRVSGETGTEYSLVVTSEAQFELEPNDSQLTAQEIGITGTVLGAVTADDPSGDYYQVTMQAEGVLLIGLELPGSGPGQIDNALLPVVQLIGPGGGLLAEYNTGGAIDDSYPSSLPSTIPAGDYTLRVFGDADTTGEYLLTVSGHDTSPPTFSVVSAAFDQSPVAPTTLLPLGSNWNYLVTNLSQRGNETQDNSDPGWFASAVFDDSLWASGDAQLGYGNNGEKTPIGYGGNSNNKYITTYFRREIDIANPSDFAELTLELLRDDGAIAYLNGVEVARSNMPTSGESFNTPALLSVGNADENALHTFLIDPAVLASGTNVLAVEVHQRAANSSDLSFDLQLTAMTTLGGRLTDVIVDFSQPIHLPSVDVNDLLIDGTLVPAGVSVVDGDTIRYSVPSIGSGPHVIELVAGEVTSQSQALLEEYSDTDVIVVQPQYTVQHGPRVQLGNAPLVGILNVSGDQIEILWQSVGAGSGVDDRFEVKYRPHGAGAWTPVSGIARTEIGSPDRLNYSATITDLDFDATYDYVVTHYRGDVETNHDDEQFDTRLPPGDTSSFTFAAYGNSSDSTHASDFEAVLSEIATFSPDFSLLLGDNAYGQGSHADYDWRLSPTMNSTADLLNRNIISYAAVGETDRLTGGGQPLRDNYSSPLPIPGITSPAVALPIGESTEHNYSFDYGDVHFATFDSDSYDDPDRLDDQLNWLVSDLANSTANWKIVFTHTPIGGGPDTSESPSDNYYQQVVSRLGAAGVDLLLASHSSTFGWTFPLIGEQNGQATFWDDPDKAYPKGAGLVQVISGVGGHALGAGTYDALPYIAQGYSADTATVSEYGFAAVSVTDSTLTVSYRTANGTILDQFTIGPDTDPPRAVLLNPADNGETDQNPLEGQIQVYPPSDLQIHITDLGDGLDPDSVLASESVNLFFNDSPLSLGSDYTFEHDAETGITTLAPVGSLRFAAGSYTIELSPAGGEILDVQNNVMPLTEFSFVATGALPTPLTPKLPAGSLIYDPVVTDRISTPDEVLDLTIDVEAGQTISVVMTPDATLRPMIEVTSPGGSPQTSVTASDVGETVLIQTFATTATGTYTISVSGVDATTGTFTIQAILNAAIEEESLGGADNATIGTAQDLAAAFVSLGTTSSGERAAVLGRTELGIPPLYEATLIEEDTLFYPNVLAFDFGDAIPPSGPGMLTVSVIADLGSNSERLRFTAEGIDFGQFFASGSSDYPSVPSVAVIEISQPQLVELAADGTISFSVAPTSTVNSFGPEYIKLVLEYPGPSVAAGDMYEVDLDAGQSISVLLTSPYDPADNSDPPPAPPAVELLDANGEVLTTGRQLGDAIDAAIIGYVARTTGPHYLRVVGETEVDYSLVVTRDAVFDVEPNNDLASAVDLNFGTSPATALGAIESEDAAGDYYRFTMLAGGQFDLKTTTPGGDVSSSPVNDLDPVLELYGPGGALLAADDNSWDGRNAHLAYPGGGGPLAAGVYTVRVSGFGTTSGDYTLEASGDLGQVDPLVVVSSDPADGGHVVSSPTEITIDFSHAIMDPNNIVASILTVDGVPADSVTVDDHDTLRFRVSAVTRGTHDVVIGAGALTDIRDQPVAAYAGQFVFEWPRVTEVILNGYPGNGLSNVTGGEHGIETIEVHFSQPLTFDVDSVALDKVIFSGGEVDVTDDAVVTISGADTLHIQFSPGDIVDTWLRVTLPSDQFDGLDGEATGSGRGYLYDSLDLPSGDGNTGGDAIFYVGSLVGNITATGDVPGTDVVVDGVDLAMILAHWNVVGTSVPADLDHSGVVGVGDLAVLVSGGGISGLESLPVTGGDAASTILPVPATSTSAKAADVVFAVDPTLAMIGPVIDQQPTAGVSVRRLSDIPSRRRRVATIAVFEEWNDGDSQLREMGLPRRERAGRRW